MSLVYGVGINDIKGSCSRKLTTKDFLKRAYLTWQSMLKRCYSEVYQRKNPTYKGCTVCERWHKLSNFIDDLPNITNYELWLNNPLSYVCLDKDGIISGNKEYRLDACQFLTIKDSCKEEHSRVGVSKNSLNAIRNAVNKMKRKVVCIYPDGQEVIFESINEAARNGFNDSGIVACCKGKQTQHHGCKFRYA